jgi:predicted dehydrogenase
MKTTNRRDFLRATAMLAAPLLLPASVFGQNAPSNRINVGIIGCGNQSTVDLPAFLGHDDVQVMAVCDVNNASYGYKDRKQFLGRKPGQEKVNAYYASKAPSGQYKGCDACNDFRDVLQRADIDAVAVIVPDHWHAIISVMAAKAGKDVYCEKPLALTVEEGQQMIKATRQYKRILQVGSHLRASPLVRHACELVRNGRIGQVKRVVAYLPPNNAIDPGPGWKPMPVPEGFDYEMWLGPAPAAPYHLDRCLYRFRFIFDYSGGQVTNFGAHDFNIVQWALGTDDTGKTAALSGRPRGACSTRPPGPTSAPGTPVVWNWSARPASPAPAAGLKEPRAGSRSPDRPSPPSRPPSRTRRSAPTRSIWRRAIRSARRIRRRSSSPTTCATSWTA